MYLQFESKYNSLQHIKQTGYLNVFFTQNPISSYNLYSSIDTKLINFQVKRQAGMSQVLNIIDTINRYSNPTNLLKLLSDTLNSVMRIFDPSGVLRGRRAILVTPDYTLQERNIHDYLIKASKDTTGHLIKIHDEVDDLDSDDFNWRVAQIPHQNFPELPPISEVTEPRPPASLPKITEPPNLPITKN